MSVFCSFFVLADEPLFVFTEPSSDALAYTCFIPRSDARGFNGAFATIQNDGIYRVPTSLSSAGSSTVFTRVDSGEQFSPSSDSTQKVIARQVLDDSGRPLGGMWVEVVWFDDDRRSHRVQTLSLTQARQLGNAGLEGYFFLERDLIGSNEFTYSIVSAAGSESSTTNPGGLVEENNVLPREVQMNSEFNSAQGGSSDAEVVSAFSWWWYVLAFVLLLFVLILIFFLLYVHDGSKDSSWKKHFYSSSVKGVAESVPIVDIATSPNKVISLLLQEDGFVLLTRQKKVLGYVSIKSMIASLLTDSIDNTFVLRDHLKAITSISKRTSIMDAQKLLRTNELLVVLEKESVRGVVNARLLLSAYEELYSQNISAFVKQPIALHLLVNEVALSIDDTLGSSFSETLYVCENGLLKGVIDEHRLLEEVYKYPDIISRMPAKQLMRPCKVMLSPNDSLFEMVRKFLDAKLDILPVVRSEKFLGVVKLSMVLNCIESYLKTD